MTKWIFVGAFVIVLCLQSYTWFRGMPLDNSMWADQAKYVQVGDPREFNASEAYGHPGGPVILSTIGIHTLGFSYTDALIVSLSILDSLLIAAAVVVIYALRKNLWWCAAIIAVLADHRLYITHSTPPSIVASLAVVLLSFYTWWLYEKGNTKRSLLFVWAALVGFTVATRLDIGCVSAVVFGALLLTRYKFRELLYAVAVAFSTFVVCDPFMWFMPIQHVIDLITKILVHYDGQQVTGTLGWNLLLDISTLTLVSVVCTANVYVLRTKVQFPINKIWFYAVCIFSVVWYGILLSAQYQAVRYFLPIIMLWECFLPLMLYTLIDKIDFSFTSNIKTQQVVRDCAYAFIIILIAAYEICTSLG